MEAWCIEVAVRPHLEDAAARAARNLLESIGLDLRRPILTIRGFLLPGELDTDAVERAATQLLADPISDRFAIAAPGTTATSLWTGFEDHGRLVVRRKPGVMDPVATSAAQALHELGIDVARVGTYRAWLLPLSADVDQSAALSEAGRRLANEVIEEVLIGTLPPGLPLPGGQSTERRVEIEIAGLTDEELVALSQARCFSLNAIEMRTIERHYRELARTPTLTELETIAQTWSEHCKHKTLTGRIHYTFEGGAAEGGAAEGGAPPTQTRHYENMLKETIFATTERIDHWMCVSVFEDNAGVIDFDGEDCLAIKVETHNHPSAIEPFGGAGTGIGGVIRDILGTGLGAKPLCNVDVFCVAPPTTPPDDVPAGCLHPARVLDGIVAGVRDYGNPIGIPTVSGAVHFDAAFVGNPLVYCGTVGILPKKKVKKAAKPGDRIIVAGGRTGRDGIHGATFSSVELTEASEMVSSGAVQIGDPITEKKVLDAQMEARDLGLYDAVTDCGAGGLSSAVGEMGEKIGARVELAHVPLKYQGLTPTEIWISEAQERMVFAVPPDKVDRLHEVFARYEVESTDIGEFTDTKQLELDFDGEHIGTVSMEFLHDGVPRPTRSAHFKLPQLTDPDLEQPEQFNDTLLAALADLCVCSKEWILRQFDHEVQGQSAAKPFAGREQRGPGDAAVLRPKPDSSQGFAVATGLNPRYSWIDPAAMAEAALDEAVRNIVARGGDPTRCVVLDNYCWGNTDDPAQLGGLVRATEAVCEAAFYYRTPFVSGKDSLNNEFRVGERTIAIPGCLLVTALAIVPDVECVPDSAFTAAGNSVYLVGRTYHELGGSVYYKLHAELGASVPRARAVDNIAQLRFLAEAIQQGLVASAHDLSEGGLAVAAAEMAFGSGVGLFLELGNMDLEEGLERDDAILFSESLGRMLVEVLPEHEEAFINWMHNVAVPARKVGETNTEARFTCDGFLGDRIIDVELTALEQAWRAPLEHGPLAAARPAGSAQ